MKKYAFPKSAKLCGQLRIKSLYEKGRNVVVPPLHFTFRITDKDLSGEPVKVLVWAKKRLFKRANKRNRIKRLLREAYRLNNEALRLTAENSNCTLQLAINYINKEEVPYRDIETSMIKGLAIVAKRLNFSS